MNRKPSDLTDRETSEETSESEGRLKTETGLSPGAVSKTSSVQDPAGNGRALGLLNQADWKTLQLKLLEYAMFKIRRLNWRTGGYVLPKGLSAEDLVIIAIHKTFEGAHAPHSLLDDAGASSTEGSGKVGVRRWNPESTPDLLGFLKSVIDSDVHHLVTSDEHRMTDFDATGLENERIADPGTNPESEYLVHETNSERRDPDDMEGFLAVLKDEFREDREVMLVICSYEEQARRGSSIKPATVAKDTGLGIREVRNAIKRMRRAIFGLQEASASKGREIHAPI